MTRDRVAHLAHLAHLAGGDGPAAQRRGEPGTAVRPSGALAREASFLAGLADVAAALRAGGTTEQAWGRGLGVGVVDGVPEPGAVRQVAPDPRTAAAVVAAARLAREVGAAPAVVLDGVVTSLVRDAHARAARDAALAGPRATARLLGWLPALGVLLGLAVGADPLPVLLDGGPGSALLGAGLVASCAGHLWTARLVAAARAAGADP